MSQYRIRIEWTDTAFACLKKLPPKARRGLLDKGDELAACHDPREAHKALTGPLKNYFRITCGRYRAIYSVREDRLANGDILATLTVQFVAAGIRKEGDKEDVYRLAHKLIALGILEEPKIKAAPIKKKP